MKRLLLLLFSACTLFFTTAHAQDYAISVKASTLGVNAELLRSFGAGFNLRAGAAFFNYQMKGGGASDQDFTYAGKLKLLSFSLLGDWFPFEGSFRFTGGALYNMNQGDLILTPTKTYTMGGSSYTPKDLGTVDAIVDFNKISPYFGIGFGNPTNGDAGLAITFDIGAVYHGAPKAKMKAEGLLAPTAEQAPVLQDNIKWFRFYPVVALGLAYEF